MGTNINSDARPLPEGWVQHYETSKQLWYYVQMNIMPPKVSFTHPADIVSTGRKRTSTLIPATGGTPNPSSPPSPAPPMPTPATSQPSGQTFAQQLFASSMDKSAPPMISASNQSLASVSRGQSTSNPNQYIAPPPPPSKQTYSLGGRQLPSLPPSANFNGGSSSTGSYANSYSSNMSNGQGNFGDDSSTLVGNGSASPPQHAVNHHIVRAQSLQPGFPNLPNHMRPPHERAQTLAYGQGPGAHNMSSIGSHQTPHIVTQARPPSVQMHTSFPNQTGNQAQPNQLPASQTPHLITQARPPSGQMVMGGQSILPNQTGNAAEGNQSPGPLSPLSMSGSATPSPPASSILFSQSSSPLTSPLSSPPMSPPYTVSAAMGVPVPNGMAPLTQNINRPPNNAASSLMTKLATKAAIGIAGNVLSNATGISAKVFTSVGNMVTDPKMISMFKSAFTKTQAPVPESELQAILQGRPNANYQAVINALVSQQQQFQMAQMQASMAYQPLPQQTVDYQALIAEIQRLQKLSQTQALAVQMQTQANFQQNIQNQYQAAAGMQQGQQGTVAQQQAQQAAIQKIQEQVYAQSLQTFQQQQQQGVAQQQAAFNTLLQQQQQQLQQQLQLQQQQLHNAPAAQHSQPSPAGSQPVGSHLNTGQQPHQNTGQQNASQKPQQNPYTQMYHQLHSAYDNIQQQQQQQQQQQPSLTDLINSSFNSNGQQPPQQQPQQPSVTDILNSALNGGQQPQQQQLSFTDIMNSALGDGGQQQQPPSFTDILNSSLNGGSSGSSPPPFDPSSLYNNPSGGGGDLLSALTQSFTNASFGGGDPSQVDTSGLAGFVNGFNQALSNPQTDTSAFTAGFNIGSLSDTITNSWSD